VENLDVSELCIKISRVSNYRMQKNLKLLLFLLCLSKSMTAYCQVDSVQVFIIGNIPNEKYQLLWDGKEMLSFKSSKSYKYSFKIHRDPEWARNGWTNRLGGYRKGRFELKFREMGGIQSRYEPKKYLIIWRNASLKERIAMQSYWSDAEPLPMPYNH
jgi:hypothetical protein